MAKNRGKAFEKEIKDAASGLNLFYYKMPIAQRGNIKLKSSPFDAFLVDGGRFFALELKSQAIYAAFPLNNIKDHQIDGLMEIRGKGCKAYLLINQRRIKKQDGKITTNNRCWVVEISKWEDLVRSLNGRKSIPTSMFEDKNGLLIELPRVHINTDKGKKLVWDLRQLLI